ncbi:hypothetical protein K438DRAFT_1853516 [Mycena galopus ATCC 62051]|nr:hypothetical protein K438DRAFT_1853516 [Mycena galopus ATCC 62051]
MRMRVHDHCVAIVRTLRWTVSPSSIRTRFQSPLPLFTTPSSPPRGWPPVQVGLLPTGMCSYIEDELRKILDGPLNIYVPAVDFGVAQKNLGPSALRPFDSKEHRQCW